MPLSLHRRGSIWHIRGSVAGQRIRQSTGLGDKRSAQIFAARIEAQAIERHTLGRQATLTFAQAALTYLESGGEARFLGPILEHFGPSTLLSDIDNDAINAAARALFPNAANATINRQLITPVSAVINLAADEGLCAPRRLRRRKAAKPRKRWLTPAEAERLLSAAPGRTAMQISFLLGTGARTNELFSLDRTDLHLESGEAFVAETKNDDPRMVCFPLRTKRLLAAAGLPEEGKVFRTPKGKPYVIRANGGGQMAGAFEAARTMAQLSNDVTPHVCRHTWATWFWAHNKDLIQLMAFGGWKTAKIALDYAKLAPASLAQDLLDHGWDFRIGTNLTQDIATDVGKTLINIR